MLKTPEGSKCLSQKISVVFDSSLFNVIKHVYIFDKFTKELKTTQKGSNCRSLINLQNT